MTFKGIIIKNLKYNIRRFAAYFFVNSFVVTVLFLYGSLLFNDILNADPAIASSQSLIVMAACGIIIFSLIFLAYTGIYFVKSRGREFGVYLTLGMTARDLVRMVILESGAVFLLSALVGNLTGLLLSKLFYLALGRILAISTDIFFISYKTFLLAVGIFLLIFIFSMLFTGRFIRKMSIVEITKSEKTKGGEKQSPVIGILSFFTLMASLWFFDAIANGREITKDIVREQPILCMCIAITGLLISLFFIIGQGIAGVRAVLKRFPLVYNRNILLLSGLSHRFLSYRVSLFSVSLLISFAVFFIGIGMSFYNYGLKTTDAYQPYDFMIERRDMINNISKEELIHLVEENGGEIERVNELSYLDCQTYRELTDRNGLFVNFRTTAYLVSESEYNRHMNENIELKEDELLLVYNRAGEMQTAGSFNTVFVVELFGEGIRRADEFRRLGWEKEELISSLGSALSLTYTGEKTRNEANGVVNSYGNLEFAGAVVSVIDDAVYESVRGGQDNSVILINLKSGDHTRIFDAILKELRIRNEADGTLWASAEISYGNKEDVNHLRPISKEERQEVLFRANGFLLFSLSFLGMLFLLSSCVVLYYKLASDTDEEIEQIGLLKKIGATAGECRKYLQSHIAVIFFAPLLFGGLLGLYMVNNFVAFTVHRWFLMSRVSLMFFSVVFVDTILYFSLRARFFRAVKL